MGDLIRMAREVEEWLAAVWDRDPAVADLIDEAVAALRAGGESVGPPFVVPVDGNPAEAAEARRGAAEEQLADLRRKYADVQAEEERIAVASQRLQAKVDAFRTRKEAIEAAYTAAEAAAEAGWIETVIEAASADIDNAGATGDEAVNADSPGPARPSLQLSELRPGAPELAGTRILFTVEPAGTAVLLAAGVESDWLRAWYTKPPVQIRPPRPGSFGRRGWAGRRLGNHRAAIPRPGHPPE